MILRSYSRGSGYGSLSRTVEEIILAFDGVYKNMKSFGQLSEMVPSNPRKQKEQAAVALVATISLLQTIGNILSRLSPDKMKE